MSTEPSPALESGSLGGVDYRISSTNHAQVQAEVDAAIYYANFNDAWQIDCKKDVISGRKSCLAISRELAFSTDGRGNESLSVGYEHFPGSITTLRIGRKIFTTSSRDGEFARPGATALQATDGSEIATRYMRWPYRSWVDAERSAFGFVAMVKLSRWMATAPK